MDLEEFFEFFAQALFPILIVVAFMLFVNYLIAKVFCRIADEKGYSGKAFSGGYFCWEQLEC